MCRLWQHDLFLKLKKCQFDIAEVEFLELVIQ